MRRIAKVAKGNLPSQLGMDSSLRDRFGVVSRSVVQLRAIPGGRPALGVDLTVGQLVRELRTVMFVGHRAEAAARLLSRRGKEARIASGRLLTLLRSRGDRFPIMSGVRKDPEPQSHRWAAVALTKTVPESIHAVEAHGYLLLHGSDREMRDGIRAIRLRSNHSEVAVPYLMEGLREGDKWRRAFTGSEKKELITTLGIIGKKAAAAIPILKGYVGGPDQILAKVAEASLRSIGRSRK